jgi:hypothetical protein
MSDKYARNIQTSGRALHELAHGLHHKVGVTHVRAMARSFEDVQGTAAQMLVQVLTYA